MKTKGFLAVMREYRANFKWLKVLTVNTLFWCCAYEANPNDDWFDGQLIKRGQFVTSYASLSEKTGLSLSEVRTALQKLIDTHYLAKRVTNKYTIITVIDYDMMQPDSTKNHKEATSQSQSRTRRPAKKTARQKNAKTPIKSSHSGIDAEAADRADRKQNNRQATSESQQLNKYSSPLREKNTADTSARPEGGGHVPPEQTSTDGLVPAKEMINFSNTVPGGQVFLVWEFRSGFEQSGTVMPPNWQELYERYVAAGESNRIEFLKRLSAGEYRERWGSF